MCFICELSPDNGYIDTLVNYEPGFQTYLNGRKFVCLDCVAQMADLAGYIPVKKSEAKTSKLRHDVEELQQAFFRVKEIVNAVETDGR